MSLFAFLTALARPALVLTLVGGCVLPSWALENDPVVKAKKTTQATEVSASATLVLTGRIRNEEGQPLAGATVYLQGSDQAVSTDEQGVFSIEVPTAGKKTLRYGYGGYQDRDVVVESSAPLTMSLHPSPETLEQRRAND